MDEFYELDGSWRRFEEALKGAYQRRYDREREEFNRIVQELLDGPEGGNDFDYA